METREAMRKKRTDTHRDVRIDTEINKSRGTCTATSTDFLQTHPPGPSSLLGKEELIQHYWEQLNNCP